MLAIYLCGAVLVTAAATMFPAATPGPVLLAGLLWPVVAVGMVQMLLIQLVVSAIRARAILPILTPSSADAERRREMGQKDSRGLRVALIERTQSY
jgi:hypothetical protein